MKINVLGDTVELTVEDFLNGTLEVKEEDAAKKIKVQEIQMKNTQAEFLLKTKKLFEVDKEITDKIEEKEKQDLMDAYSKEEPVVKADLNEKTEIVPEENRIKPNPAFERTVEESFISAADDMNVIMDKQEDIKEEVEEYKKEKPEVTNERPSLYSGSAYRTDVAYARPRIDTTTPEYFIKLASSADTNTVEGQTLIIGVKGLENLLKAEAKYENSIKDLNDDIVGLTDKIKSETVVRKKIEEYVNRFGGVNYDVDKSITDEEVIELLEIGGREIREILTNLFTKSVEKQKGIELIENNKKDVEEKLKVTEEALKEAKETTKNYCVTLQDNLQKARNMDKLNALEAKQEEERAKARLAYEKQIATIKDSMSIKEPEADVNFDVVGNFVTDTTRADEILKMTNISLNGEEPLKQVR